MTFNRRNFIVGSGIAAGVALAANLTGLKASGAAPSQKAESAIGQAPAFYKTKVGDIEVTTFLDGSMVLPDKALLNATAEEIANGKRENFLPEGDSFPAFISAFLIKNGDRRTLVDTGAKGYAPTTGHLMTRMKMAGVTPDMVDEVVMTHLHPDHAGGLLNDAGGIAFPKARLRISEEELSFWTDAKTETALPDKKGMIAGIKKSIAPYRKEERIETFKLGGDLGKGLSSVDLRGHTPGHGGVRISDGKEQLMIWADIVHVPAVQFADPGVGIGFDIDPDAARKAREKTFDEAATDRLRIMGSHLWHPPVGHVERRSGGKGYRFAVQMWEADIA